MSSELQNRARNRNWFKLRIMGSYTHMYGNHIHPEEAVILKEIEMLRKVILDNFDNNSVELGIKPKPKKIINV